MTKRNAIIFARVSTKDQEEFGHSLPAQTQKLREYAERHNLEVIREFSFSESAGTKIRKKFEEVLTFLRKHDKDSIPVLLCQNVDRVTRNFKDAVDLDEMRLHSGLEIHFVQDGFFINAQATGQQMFMWESKVFLAKQFLNRLTDDAQRSLKYKLEKGEYTSKAPIGYVNARDEQGKATVILDEERFMLVRKLFTEYAKGIYSIGELTRMAEKWGLRSKGKRQTKLSPSHVHHLLQTSFYHGVMLCNGKHYPHKYPPLIDEATFQKCQEVRLGWNKKPFKYSEKPFVFRGLLYCGHCGCAYSSEIKKGKYVYLSCTKNRDPNCPAPRMREEEVVGQLTEVFDRMAFPSSIMQDIRKHLNASSVAKQEFQVKALEVLQKDYSRTQRQLSVLLDAMINESITQNEYDEKARELKQRQQEINQQLRGFESAEDDFAISVKMLLELVNNAGRLFRSSNIEQKRKLINLVCQNLIVTDGTISYSLRKPFELFLEEPKHQIWLACLSEYQNYCRGIPEATQAVVLRLAA